MKAILLSVFLGATMACGAPATRVETAESAASPAFAKYHTFAFRPAAQPTAPFEVTARSFEVERRMRPLIVAELLHKGYTEQTGQDKPDFVLAFDSGYSKEVMGNLEQAGGAGPASAPPIVRGKLTVDAFDASTDGQVWHGTAEAEVNPKRIDDQLLQVAVEKLLAPFPSRNSLTAAQTP
ncbi:MAG: DUF4136 domain-containing protein [Polyangiaceae bacterium]|jgi:hypothetical protein